jgi:hypothetical protein
MNNNTDTNTDQGKLDECARETHRVVRLAMRVQHPRNHHPRTPAGAVQFVADETGADTEMVLALLDRGLLLGLRPVVGLQA